MQSQLVLSYFCQKYAYFPTKKYFFQRKLFFSKICTNFGLKSSKLSLICTKIISNYLIFPFCFAALPCGSQLCLNLPYHHDPYFHTKKNLVLKSIKDFWLLFVLTGCLSFPPPRPKTYSAGSFICGPDPNKIWWWLPYRVSLTFLWLVWAHLVTTFLPYKGGEGGRREIYLFYLEWWAGEEFYTPR